MARTGRHSIPVEIQLFFRAVSVLLSKQTAEYQKVEVNMCYNRAIRAQWRT